MTMTSRQKTLVANVGKRKYYTQMEKAEQLVLIGKLQRINKWTVSGHVMDRIEYREVNTKNKNKILAVLKDCQILEYKVDEWRGQLDERILVKSNYIFQGNENLIALFSLTTKRVVTLWLKDSNYKHENVNINARSYYDKNMVTY